MTRRGRRHRLRGRVSPEDQRQTEGIGRRAPAGASPRPEAERYRRPAAPRSGAALIYIRIYSATQRGDKHGDWRARPLGAAEFRGCRWLEQVRSVVLADGWRVLIVQGVEDADGVGLVGQLGDVCLGGPAEGGGLVAGA